MPGRRIASPFPTSGAKGRSVNVADGWARNSPDSRVFHVARQGEAFHAVSRRFETTSGFANPLPVSGRHLNAFYFLNIRDFKTFWTVPDTFPSTSGSRILLPVHNRDRKWNANKSVSLSPAIISLQCRLGASSRHFAPIVSKMAAKTTSGSGFDRKFGLAAPGFFT